MPYTSCILDFIRGSSVSYVGVKFPTSDKCSFVEENDTLGYDYCWSDVLTVQRIFAVQVYMSVRLVHVSSRETLYWEVQGFKRGPGRQRANWISTVKKDLRKITLTWEEAEVAALDRPEWCRSVAQCIHWMRVESRSRSFRVKKILVRLAVLE